MWRIVAASREIVVVVVWFGMLYGMWPGPIGTLLAMAVAVLLVAVVVLFVSAILRLTKRKDK